MKMYQSFRLKVLLFLILIASCQPQQETDVGFFNIVKYGAVGDGKTLNTKSIQQAIDAAFEAGGGTVIIPPGKYVSGTIFLKDNVTLRVEGGATLFGSPNIEDYTEMTWGHNKDRQPYHLVMAKDAKNITIEGAGTIDGNGQSFWKEYDPSKDPQWIMAQELKVSPMMEIQDCVDVRIKDVTLTTGGGWTLHLYDSERIQVQGAKIINNVFAPNGDGIDISGCSDVTISDCIIKTCDDAICVKTMVDTKEAKRIAVTNCIIECSCAALKIGNETFRDIKQITFSNCIIYNSSRAFAVYAESAGTVEDITVNNIITDSKAPLLYNRPIHLSLYLPEPGAGGRNGDWMFKEKKQWNYEGRKPKLRNITISNFHAKTGGRILMTAGEGYMIENLTLRDVIMTYPWIEDPVPFVDDVTSSQFAPVRREAKMAKAAIVTENIKNFTLDNLIINWPETKEMPEDWQFEKKIANGTLKAFFPESTQARQAELSVIWGKNIQQGRINVPFAQASSTSMPRFKIQNSDIKNLN
ncbi:MAG: glycosyl hydrolase family 28 protein [Bacteroidota bacterium]